MDSFTVWRDFFRNWPGELPRKGVAVTAGDQVPFIGFLASDTMVVLERPAPDAVGARKVLVAFHDIAAVKITDVVKPNAFQGCGFEGSLPKR